MITQEEIQKAYDEIKYKNIDRLNGLVEKEIARFETHKAEEKAEIVAVVETCLVFSSLGKDKEKIIEPKNSAYEIKVACEEEIMKPETSAKITQMIKNNPNVMKNSLEIVQLVAPAVAQVLGGIPALAIVGTILILIKQGILNRMIVS